MARVALFFSSARCVGQFAATCFLSAAMGIAHAHSTGTVPSPAIKRGGAVAIAGGMAVDNGGTGFAHRLDYRHGVNDRLRLGAFFFFNDRGGSFRYRRTELEAQYQFARRQTGWNSAVQIRGGIPDGNDGPGRIRLAWLNSWRFEDGVELRLAGFGSRQFGDARRNGVRLETRAEATFPVAPETRFGAQILNNYNTTADFGSFSSQRHLVGAITKGKLGETISYRASVLKGLTAATSDVEFRLRFAIAI